MVLAKVVVICTITMGIGNVVIIIINEIFVFPILIIMIEVLIALINLCAILIIIAHIRWLILLLYPKIIPTIGEIWFAISLKLLITIN
jgi:hypothetical protein